MLETKSKKQWSGELVFILAAIGYAVGLGNIWRFSYVVGVNGGGGFVLIYLFCVVFIALPILLCDFIVGRRGGGSPPRNLRVVAILSGASPWWSLIGWLGLVAALIVMSYYSVIAGWTLVYFFQGLIGEIAQTKVSAELVWQSLLSNPSELAFWHTGFMVLLATVSAFGLHRGIERFVKMAMPLFLLTLVGLVGYGVFVGDFGAAIMFLFEPRMQDINATILVAALGQALWSLGVGASVLMVYGAYLPADVNLTRSAIIIAFGDAGAALLGGLAIFPLVFASGMSPANGPGLIFQTLPIALAAAPGGAFISTLFFLLLLVAGFTSAIGILELVVAWGEEQFNIRRVFSVVIVASLAWALGFATILSFNVWSDFYPLGFIGLFEQSTIYDVMDFSIANIVMPVASIALCIFVGWKVKDSLVLEELKTGPGPWYLFWRILIRWIIPIVLTILMIALILES